MSPPRKILIACDKFKGSLTAEEACAAIARGLSARDPDAIVTVHPIADGGEGFAKALEIPLEGRWIEAPAHDALGRPVTARYLLADTPDGPLAVMEMAEASGLWRIPPEERDILRSSTFGTGEMMRHAVQENGVQRILIGIGGSATNDGGAGMAAALGVRLLAEDGGVLDPGPASLSGRLFRIDESRLIALPRVTVACDVASPLLGPDGATRVFGPQKGATEADILLLETMLAAWVRACGGETQSLVPGAGAAGGLGFGLLRFARAELVPGFDLLASLTGLEARIADADLIITGEGSLDAQSLTGKGPVGIAKLARKHDKPVIAFCGSAAPEIHASGWFDSVIELASTRLAMETLMSDAARLLEAAARELRIR